MFGFTRPVSRLIEELKKLPGIGSKSAQRIAFHILRADSSSVLQLSESIADAKKNTLFCTICNNISTENICEICSDQSRDESKLCVVEEPFNIFSIDRTGLFKGFYHVLGGNLSPIKGIGPDELKIDGLKKRISGGGVKELILATSPTTEGNATAYFIYDIFRKVDLKITRIALGIPVGSDIDYVDSVTIAKSFEGRVEFK